MPALEGSAYDGASIRNVLNMASGVVFDEDYLDYNSDINKMSHNYNINAAAAATEEEEDEVGREIEQLAVRLARLNTVAKTLAARATREPKRHKTALRYEHASDVVRSKQRLALLQLQRTQLQQATAQISARLTHLLSQQAQW